MLVQCFGNVKGYKTAKQRYYSFLYLSTALPPPDPSESSVPLLLRPPAFQITLKIVCLGDRLNGVICSRRGSSTPEALGINPFPHFLTPTSSVSLQNALGDRSGHKR